MNSKKVLLYVFLPIQGHYSKTVYVVTIMMSKRAVRGSDRMGLILAFLYCEILSVNPS